MNGIQTFLKKSRISKILVSVIIPLVLLLSFLGSSRKIYADEVPSFSPAPSVVVTPNLVIENTGVYFDFYANISGEYDHLEWWYSNNVNGNYGNFVRSSQTGLVFNGRLDYNSYFEKKIYCRVYYYSNNDLVYINSNIVTSYNSSSNQNIAQLAKFEDFANILFYRFIEWFDIFLVFMLDNPIVFVFMALAIIIASIGTIRHVIGGSHEKKDFSY